MSVGCNEVDTGNVNADVNAERMQEIFSYWSSKPNIKKRFMNSQGIYETDMSFRNLGSFVNGVLDKPFSVEQNFTVRQLENIKVLKQL